MHIDTHTKETLEAGLISCLDMELESLYKLIGFAKEVEDNDLQSFDDTIVNTLKGKKFFYQIEELSFYHFSRRLHGTENDVTGCNLKDLLLAKNMFSDFLMDHGITFALNGESIDTIYKGKHVHWKKRINGNPYYMLSRLGSNGEIGDYCFNGLAFKDAILNNIYSRSLFYCPEIITQLSECLRCPSLEEDYSNNSDYYLYEYRVPINQVLFDAHDDYTIPQKQEYFICRIAERLHEYMYSDGQLMRDDRNPILRIHDKEILSPKCFVGKELITWEMLCN